MLEQLVSHFSTTTYKYIPEVNDFKGGFIDQEVVA